MYFKHWLLEEPSRRHNDLGMGAAKGMVQSALQLFCKKV